MTCCTQWEACCGCTVADSFHPQLVKLPTAYGGTRRPERTIAYRNLYYSALTTELGTYLVFPRVCRSGAEKQTRPRQPLTKSSFLPRPSASARYSIDFLRRYPTLPTLPTLPLYLLHAQTKNRPASDYTP